MKLSEREYRRVMRDANNRIYFGVSTFLMGNKWHGTYVIDNSQYGTTSKVIRITKNYLKCSVYFSYQIRISISERTKKLLGLCEPDKLWQEFYSFSGDNENCIAPDDIDEYVRVSTEFLRELLKHIDCLAAANFESIRKPRGFENCSFDNFVPYCDSHFDLLRYEYNYDDDKDLIEYVTHVMKTKAFKRSRK